MKHIENTPHAIEAQAAIDLIAAGFAEIFPGRQCEVFYRNMLGPYLQININMLKKGEKPNRNITLNSPGYSTFLMHLSDNVGRPINVGDVVEIDGTGSRVKFRRIKAVGAVEAAKKFIVWAKKNADAFIAFNP